MKHKILVGLIFIFVLFSLAYLFTIVINTIQLEQEDELYQNELKERKP